MALLNRCSRGIFHYGGSICFAALNREGFNQAISKAHPQFQLRYVEPKGNPGCTEGIEMLLDKELSLAQNAEPVSQKEQESARKRGFELDSIPVAIDGIVFYTHKELGIKSLSLPQVRDIYLGKIKNWQEVGGIDWPITPVSLPTPFGLKSEVRSQKLEIITRSWYKASSEFTQR